MKKFRGNHLKLHLGSGGIILPGFVNVDALSIPGVGFVTDLSDLSVFKDKSAELIYASHHLEHFPTAHAPKLLKEYYRVLESGGVLRVSVPDLDTICELYVKNKDWFTPPHNPWLGLIYGGQDYQYNFHKTGFNFLWLKYLLEKAGFVDVKRFKPSEEFGIQDGSFADRPFNRKISLNVGALKPSLGRGEGQVRAEFQYTWLEKFLDWLERVVERIENEITSRRLQLIRRRRRKVLRDEKL